MLSLETTPRSPLALSSSLRTTDLPADLENAMEVRTKTYQEHLIDTKLTRKSRELDEVQKQLKSAQANLDDSLTALNIKSQEVSAMEHRKQLLLEQLGSQPTDSDTFIEEESPLTISALKERLEYKNYTRNLLVSFLSALRTNQIITLFGKPGSGKTTFVSAVSAALGAKCTMISVQNNWTDGMDLMGYYNPAKEHFESTPFTEALLDAYDESLRYGEHSRLHIICLDEMNLSRVEYYFASFLSLLQQKPKDRQIKLLPYYLQNKLQNRDSGLQRYKDFILPSNVRFVGTINSDDSTNLLSPKVIDRSFFIEMVSGNYEPPCTPQVQTYYSLAALNQNPDTVMSDDRFDADRDLRDMMELFKGESFRFKSYLKDMWLGFQSFSGTHDVSSFEILMIKGKILPAVRKKECYQYGQLTPLLNDRIHGEFYDHLGGAI